MGLSIKFPRTVLYVSTMAMGLGLLKPSTIIEQLQLKELIGHTRFNTDTHQLVSILHEKLQFHCGFSLSISNIPDKSIYWERTWLNHAYSSLRMRKITLANKSWSFYNISKNNTLMDFARHFSSKFRDFRKINLCHHFKRVIYPFKLLYPTRKHPTTTYYKNFSESQLNWKFFTTTSAPSKTSWTIWRKFVKWLRVQHLTFTNDIDIEKYAIWWITVDEITVYKRVNNQIVEIYIQTAPPSRVYEIIQHSITPQILLIPVLVHHGLKGKLTVLDFFHPCICQHDLQSCSSITTADERKLLASIIENTALTYVNITKETNAIVFYAILTITSNDFEVCLSQGTNNWQGPAKEVDKARALVEILTIYYNLCSPMTSGSIEVYTDSKTSIRWASYPMTASKAAKPCGEFWSYLQILQRKFPKIKVHF